MGQNAPRYHLEKLPQLREKAETIEILRQTNKSTAAIAELKGIAKTTSWAWKERLLHDI